MPWTDIRTTFKITDTPRGSIVPSPTPLRDAGESFGQARRAGPLIAGWARDTSSCFGPCPRGDIQGQQQTTTMNCEKSDEVIRFLCHIQRRPKKKGAVDVPHRSRLS